MTPLWPMSYFSHNRPPLHLWIDPLLSKCVNRETELLVAVHNANVLLAYESFMKPQRQGHEKRLNF